MEERGRWGQSGLPPILRTVGEQNAAGSILKIQTLAEPTFIRSKQYPKSGTRLFVGDELGTERVSVCESRRSN